MTYIQQLYLDYSAFHTRLPDHFSSIRLGFQIPLVGIAIRATIPNGNCHMTKLFFLLWILLANLHTTSYLLEYSYIPYLHSHEPSP